MKGFEPDTHRCPVDRCTNEIPDSFLMCSAHWVQLSPFKRDQIRSARARMAGHRSAKAKRYYDAVCRAAISSVEAGRTALAIA